MKLPTQEEVIAAAEAYKRNGGADGEVDAFPGIALAEMSGGAMDDVETKIQAMKEVQASADRCSKSVSEMLEACKGHAAAGATALSRFEAAQQTLLTAREEGAGLRATHRVRTDLEGVQRILEIGGETALHRCLLLMEAVAWRVFGRAQPDDATMSDLLNAARTREVSPVSRAALEAISAQVGVVDSALEQTWRAWLESGGSILYQGARALTLAPPGDLANGLDGLSAEREALEEARQGFDVADRIDALFAVIDAAAGQVGAVLKSPSCDNPTRQRLYQSLVARCSDRLARDMQVAPSLSRLSRLSKLAPLPPGLHTPCISCARATRRMHMPDACRTRGARAMHLPQVAYRHAHAHALAHAHTMHMHLPQVACRLASAAPHPSADGAAVLEAISEATRTAAHAVRAIASVFGLVPASLASPPSSTPVTADGTTAGTSGAAPEQSAPPSVSELAFRACRTTSYPPPTSSCLSAKHHSPCMHATSHPAGAARAPSAIRRCAHPHMARIRACAGARACRGGGRAGRAATRPARGPGQGTGEGAARGR